MLSVKTKAAYSNDCGLSGIRYRHLVPRMEKLRFPESSPVGRRSFKPIGLKLTRNAMPTSFPGSLMALRWETLETRLTRRMNTVWTRTVIWINNKSVRATIAIFTDYKKVFWYLHFASHRTKESFVSTENKPLVGTLMKIGDVTVSIAIVRTPLLPVVKLAGKRFQRVSRLNILIFLPILGWTYSCQYP